jgi:hypothetical protein
MILLAALVRLVLAVRALIPTRARDDWLAFLPEGDSAHPSHWDTVCSPLPSFYPLPNSSSVSSSHFGWLFPCTQEFPKDQPLRDSFLLADHLTLQCIARPSLHALSAYISICRSILWYKTGDYVQDFFRNHLCDIATCFVPQNGAGS